MTIFFFLSAWGLSESQNRNKYTFVTFVRRRLTKVYIPLVITNLLYIIFLVCVGKKTFDLSDLLLTTLNLEFCDGVLWFCNTILVFYLIFYFSYLPKTKWIKASLCLGLTLIYSITATWLWPESPFYVYSIIGFPFGMICSLYKDKILRCNYWSVWSISALFLLIFGTMLLPEHKNLFLMNVFCYFLLVILIAIIQRLEMPKSLTILPFVGTYSYEIYLLHNKVLVPVGNAGYILWYPLAFLLIVIPLAVVVKKAVNGVLKVLG